MNKRKILTLALALCMVAILAVGGSIAYFMDTDAQANVFTIGNVKIDLWEDFNTDKLPLIPAVGGTTDGGLVYEYQNTIEKEVYVENTGKQDAFVRVMIAIPDLYHYDNYDENDQVIDPAKSFNALGVLYDDMTTLSWSWNKTSTGANYPAHDGAAAAWNFFKNVTIKNVPYKVYVVTYEKVLPAEAGTDSVTVDAIHKAYMDPSVTQEDIAKWDELYGDSEWAKIYVAAQAIQSEGWFEEGATADEIAAAAFTALDEGHGVITSEYLNDIEWTVSKGKFAEEEYNSYRENANS